MFLYSSNLCVYPFELMEERNALCSASDVRDVLHLVKEIVQRICPKWCCCGAQRNWLYRRLDTGRILCRANVEGAIASVLPLRSDEKFSLPTFHCLASISSIISRNEIQQDTVSLKIGYDITIFPEFMSNRVLSFEVFFLWCSYDQDFFTHFV